MNSVFTLDLLSKEKNLIEVFCEQEKDEDRPVVLFGAGALGRSYAEYLLSLLPEVKLLFCDNNTKIQGTTISNIPVLSFSELKANFSHTYIFITSFQYYDSILKQLEENNLQGNLINIPPQRLTLGFIDLIKNHFNEFKETFEILEDDYSRKIFIERINLTISLDSKYLVPLKSNSAQYFDPEIINVSENEVFIDGGAFTGDTVDEFIVFTGGKFKTIYSFEPEISKKEIFLKQFETKENIYFFSYGLWDKNDALYFNAQNNMSSMLDICGTTKVELVSIDEFIHDQVSFIKLDVEGAELNALKGSKNTIIKYKPKLAICVYHKPLDIVEIPLYLKQLVPEYKFYLRHYSNTLYDTVLYAVL